ncbi:hypothetical protein [Lederbergia graminis]|uniref:Zinc ribbon domain-containing protein n=1 Tax=Lederbergia graminis TaxID=735518 RepID=A0ABW0LFY3_9BACI
MGYCIKCGNALKPGGNFCGHCGFAIEKNEEITPEILQQPQQVTTSVATQPKTARKNNKIWMAIVLALAVFIVYQVVTPKKLTEKEFTDLSIEIIVLNQIAQDKFRQAIKYSDVPLSLDPEWTPEYKKLVTPAEKLIKDFEANTKRLKKVKAPEHLQFEQENLQRMLHAYKNMAVHIRSYAESGDENDYELYEEYENRAEDYLEDSIFVAERYEDTIREKYMKLRLNTYE